MHQDLTPGVMAGLAWYYLLAAMLNAAAAAYVAYMEMVSEGASRVGLAPRTRRLPDWLAIAFFGLYGLAVIVILGRHVLPGALDIAYCLGALANALLAITAGADAAHFAEVRESVTGHGRWRDGSAHPTLDDHIPAVGLGKPINRTLWTLIWSIVALVFQAMGITYLFGGADHSAAVHPRRRRLRLRPDHVLRRCDDRLRRDARLPPVPGQRPGGLVDRQPVSALLRPEHDRLRFPRHRHQARQRADRRADRSGRLLHLAQPAAGGDQRRPDGPGIAQPGSSSSPTRP